MTYRRMVDHTFACDDDDCSNRMTFRSRGSNKSYAVSKARRDGWSVFGGNHYCPECNTKDTLTCPDCGSWNVDHRYDGEAGTCRECGANVGQPQVSS